MMDNPTILIIDNDDDRAFLACLLRAVGGYRVVTAAADQHCYELARNHSPDLIIAGLELNEHPCWQIVERLRANGVRPPILGATIFAPVISRAQAQRAGCADLIEKPFNIDDLLSRITNLLRPSAHASLAA